MVFGLALVHHFCNSSATCPREGLLADFKRCDVFKRPLIYGENDFVLYSQGKIMTFGDVD